jgi:sulfonate transport system ATP-binding protein
MTPPEIIDARNHYLDMTDWVEELADTAPPRPTTAPKAKLSNSPGVGIEISGLRKSFGETEVLHGLDLSIEPGEFVAVVGRSGCGKSTLLRLLAGLDSPSLGEISIDASPVNGLAPHTRIMFQDSRLLPWRRVLANVGIGLKGEWRDKALESLKAVGLDTRQGEWPSVLSGGQRQRVALARALVANPRLLLLDEPLGALDALTRLEMQSLIEAVWMKQGFTALLVTHDVAEAVALGDRVVLIDKGRITLDQRIDLPRPRRRGMPEMAELEGHILSHILGMAEPAWF